MMVLCGDQVTELMSRLRAGAKRAKTQKLPILIHHVRTLLATLNPIKPAVFVRDCALILIGLLAGLRRREIAGLCVGDVQWDAQRRELRIQVVRDKTNVSLLESQAPRVVFVAHALLTELWPRFAARFVQGRAATAALFPRCDATGRVTPDHLAPDTISTIVRERLSFAPGISTHSLRVGCATELHAAGVSLPDIMEIGRWTSLTALLYVLPSADKMTAACRKMGDGGVCFDRVAVQRVVRTDAEPPRVRRG
jgi:integrase